MPQISRSAVLYQERKLPQDRPTLRGPGPRSDFDRNAAHFLTMTPPLPLPEILLIEGNQPPDSGRSTLVWPFGVERP